MYLIAPIQSSIARRVAVQLAIAALLVFNAAGCRMFSEPGSASFASVTIQNHSEAEIAAATAQVFGADGYQGRQSDSGKMVFEKEASRGTTLSRSGVVATHEGATSLNRVKVQIVKLAGGAHRLQCEAFVVSDPGDSFWEDEVRLTNMRSGPYQNLLDKVAAQLSAKAKSTSAAQSTQR